MVNQISKAIGTITSNKIRSIIKMRVPIDGKSIDTHNEILR